MGGEVRKFRRRAAQLKRKADRKAAKAQELTQANIQSGQKKKTGVMVAVPTISGNVHWSIAHQFVRLGANSVHPECPWKFITHVQAGCRPIEFARNTISELFVHETDCEWLVMVDEDQVMPDDWYKILLVNDADVVAAKTYCWVGNDYKPGRLRVNQYSLDEKGECFNIQPPPTNGQPYEVNIVGTGCIAIRRRVFNKIGCAPWYFTRHWNGRFRGSEDINFSVACKRAGFKIAVHPGVVFGHVKPLDLTQISETIEAVLEMKEKGESHTIESMKSLG